jgi:hypothetical protein
MGTATILVVDVLLWFARRPRAPGSSIVLFTLWCGGRSRAHGLPSNGSTSTPGLHGSQLTAVVVIGIVVAGLAVRRRGLGRGPSEQQRLHSFPPRERARTPGS